MDLDNLHSVANPSIVTARPIPTIHIWDLAKVALKESKALADVIVWVSILVKPMWLCHFVIAAVRSVLTVLGTIGVAVNPREADFAMAIFVGMVFVGFLTGTPVLALAVVVAGISSLSPHHRYGG